MHKLLPFSFFQNQKEESNGSVTEIKKKKKRRGQKVDKKSKHCTHFKEKKKKIFESLKLECKAPDWHGMPRWCILVCTYSAIRVLSLFKAESYFPVKQWFQAVWPPDEMKSQREAGWACAWASTAAECCCFKGRWWGWMEKDQKALMRQLERVCRNTMDGLIPLFCINIYSLCMVLSKVTAYFHLDHVEKNKSKVVLL